MKKTNSKDKATLDKKANCYKHTNCGGSIMTDGIHTKITPVDIGIAGTSDGVLIVLKRKITKYVHGGCMKCRKDGLFQLSIKFMTTSRTKKFAA